MIYIGSDYLIDEADVLGIFDMETTTTRQTTRDYLSAAQKSGRIVNVSYEIPKTFIVCTNRDGRTVRDDIIERDTRPECDEFVVYLSQYSASTIMKRKLF